MIYSDLVPTIYLQELLFLGLPFYFVLLVYMLFKNRERRKKDAERRAPGPVPPAGGTPPTASVAKGTPLPSSQTLPASVTGATAASAAAAQEFNCPKCNAVVYAGEKTCWKCGAALPTTPGKAG